MTTTATAQTAAPTLWATIVKRITLATIAVAVLLGATLAATGTASAVTPPLRRRPLRHLPQQARNPRPR